MRTNGITEVKRSLDHLLGKVEALAGTLEAHGEQLGHLGERVAQLEQGVRATKDVVEAFTTAKSSMRFLKWLTGLLAAGAGIIAAMKGWLQK
jgi:ABC-type transporter Mla subunit MlaD